MICVTTFPEWGYEVYAKYCLSTWVQFWPGSILAYYEGDASPVLEGVEFRPLESVEMERFLEICPENRRGFLFAADRFCHKVFAQLETMDEHERFWWLDADVELKKPIPEALIEDITNQSFVSFMGRNTYTETGVIAFNQSHEDFPRFRQRYRSCYVDCKLFELDGWTDCHAFDYARDGKGHNLTPEGRGFDNVLRTIPLGEYMEHHKGKLKLDLEKK